MLSLRFTSFHSTFYSFSLFSLIYPLFVSCGGMHCARIPPPSPPHLSHTHTRKKSRRHMISEGEYEGHHPDLVIPSGPSLENKLFFCLSLLQGNHLFFGKSFFISQLSHVFMRVENPLKKMYKTEQSFLASTAGWHVHCLFVHVHYI